jgi:glycosyltransferase involved in cell wall biosynthesis
MRIALVSEHASPLATLGGADGGGQNVHVAELARALAAQGAEVVVHTRRDDPELPRRVPFAPGVEIDHVDAGPARHVPKDELLPHMEQFADELEETWASAPPDVVHAHFWMSGLAASAAARPHGIPVVMTFHALGAEKRRHHGERDPSPPERLGAEAVLARESAAVIATSSAETFWLRRMGADVGRVAVIPCGVDLERFAPLADARAARPPGPPRLASLGRLVERKGVGTIVEALPELPGVELLVAGGGQGPLADDAEHRRLSALAGQLGLAERVRFLGPVSRDGACDVLAAADVAVCVPWYEPFGIVPVEAMAAGVPVVGAAVGGLLDTVVHDETGLLVPPRNPALLGRALAALLADPARRRRMGAAGARRAAQRYGWPRIAERTLRVYLAICGRRAPMAREARS